MSRAPALCVVCKWAQACICIDECMCPCMGTHTYHAQACACLQIYPQLSTRVGSNSYQPRSNPYPMHLCARDMPTWYPLGLSPPFSLYGSVWEGQRGPLGAEAEVIFMPNTLFCRGCPRRSSMKSTAGLRVGQLVNEPEFPKKNPLPPSHLAVNLASHSS